MKGWRAPPETFYLRVLLWGRIKSAHTAPKSYHSLTILKKGFLHTQRQCISISYYLKRIFFLSIQKESLLLIKNNFFFPYPSFLLPQLLGQRIAWNSSFHNNIKCIERLSTYPIDFLFCRLNKVKPLISAHFSKSFPILGFPRKFRPQRRLKRWMKHHFSWLLGLTHLNQDFFLFILRLLEL